MNLTPEVIDRIVKVARAWKKASVQERIPMNYEWEAALAGLSEKQLEQVGKIIRGKV